MFIFALISSLTLYIGNVLILTLKTGGGGRGGGVSSDAPDLPASPKTLRAYNDEQLMYLS